MTLATLGAWIVSALFGVAFGWVWMTMRLWRREANLAASTASVAIDLLVAEAQYLYPEDLVNAATCITNALQGPDRRYMLDGAIREMQRVIRTAQQEARIRELQGGSR